MNDDDEMQSVGTYMKRQEKSVGFSSRCGAGSGTLIDCNAEVRRGAVRGEAGRRAAGGPRDVTVPRGIVRRSASPELRGNVGPRRSLTDHRRLPQQAR